MVHSLEVRGNVFLILDKESWLLLHGETLKQTRKQSNYEMIILSLSPSEYQMKQSNWLFSDCKNISSAFNFKSESK